MRTSALFGEKKTSDFFRTRGMRSHSSRFCAEVFYGRPLMLKANLIYQNILKETQVLSFMAISHAILTRDVEAVVLSTASASAPIASASFATCSRGGYIRLNKLLS